MSSFHNWLPARCPGSTLPNAYGCSFPTASFATIMVGSICFTVRNASCTSQDIRIQSSSLCCKNHRKNSAGYRTACRTKHALFIIRQPCKLSSNKSGSSNPYALRELACHQLPFLCPSKFSRTSWTIACKLFHLSNLHSTKHPC